MRDSEQVISCVMLPDYSPSMSKSHFLGASPDNIILGGQSKEGLQDTLVLKISFIEQVDCTVYSKLGK